MPVNGDFSSLLQFGAGLGIGLSLFRAPVDLRVSRIMRTLDGELTALQGIRSAFARTKRRDMMDLKLRFTATRQDLEAAQIPYMIAAIIGAICNITCLIYVALNSGEQATTLAMAIFLFLSIGFFIIIILLLEILARLKLSGILTSLTELRQRRNFEPAPPIVI